MGAVVGLALIWLCADAHQMALKLLAPLAAKGVLLATYTGELGSSFKRKPYTQLQKSGLTSTLWKKIDSQLCST
jgi:hypothetical protein